MMREGCGAGLAVMGDVTYRHVFGGNDTTGDVTSRQPRAIDATIDSLFSPVPSLAQQEAFNAPESQPGDDMTEARCALCTLCHSLTNVRICAMSVFGASTTDQCILRCWCMWALQ